jgi:hypothetical protein
MWRLLLPGTPFPTCGMPEDFVAAGERTELATASGCDDVATAAGEQQRSTQS